MDGARTRGHARRARGDRGDGPRPARAARHPAERAGRRRQDDARAGPRGGPAVRAPGRRRRGRAGRAVAAGWSSTAIIRTSIGSRPEGPGGQIVIGGRDAKVRGVRDLIGELVAACRSRAAARVAIIEAAHRMNEDAQAALLKTLEEPPAGVTIVLCADDEDRLLPTVRSRCARIRLGPVGAARRSRRSSASTAWPTPPLAARLARLAGGRPGRGDRLRPRAGGRPDPRRARADPARPRSIAARRARLVAMREARPAALAMAAALDGGAAAAQASGDDRRRDARPAGRAQATAPAPPDATAGPTTTGDAPADDALDRPSRGRGRAGKRSRPPQRRRAAEMLVSVWIDVARDLAAGRRPAARARSATRTCSRSSTAAAADLPDRAAAAALARPGRSAPATLLARNVSPELVLDVAGARLAAPPPAPRDRRAPARARGGRPRAASRASGSATSSWREAMALGPRRAGSRTSADGSRPVRRRGSARPLEAFLDAPPGRSAGGASSTDVGERWRRPPGGDLGPVRGPQRGPPRRLTPLRPSPGPDGTGGLFPSATVASATWRTMEQNSPAEELPALYRAILDRVAELERDGARAEAARVRAAATRIYSRAWDDAPAAASRTCSGGPRDRRPARPAPEAAGPGPSAASTGSPATS